MRTSGEWWAETKSSPEKLVAWLRKQYHGELGAAARIQQYCLAQLEQNRWRTILEIIAGDELTHAEWIGALLVTRGERPAVIEGKTERYWAQTLGGARSFVDAAAVAHLAEEMRLERIRVIAGDADAPADVRAVFERILLDEQFHAKAFAAMAGAAAVLRAKEAHGRGKEAIGFVSGADA